MVGSAETVLQFVAPILFLLVMGGTGSVLLWRIRAGLDPLEIVAYGFPLGCVATTILLLVAGIAYGRLTTEVVVGVGAMCLGGSVVLGWPGLGAWRNRFPTVSARQSTGQQRLGVATMPSHGHSIISVRDVWTVFGSLANRISWAPTLLVGSLTIIYALFWRDAVTYQGDGLGVSDLNLWGDWSLHIGDVHGFVYGDNFPPGNLRFAGDAYSYHFLSALTAAAIAKLGLSPVEAMLFHSWALSSGLVLALYAFGRRLLCDRAMAILGTAFFLLGGGYAWILTARAISTSGDFWETLRERPYVPTEAIQPDLFTWGNNYYSLILIQRAFIYGFPLFMLIVTLLMLGIRRRSLALFAFAGVLVGILPLANLSTLLMLALVLPFFAILFPSTGWRYPWRNWLAFFLIAVAIALPILLWQQGGDRGATEALRWDPGGWVPGTNPDWWFFVKHLGWLIPLAVVALASRNLLRADGKRVLVAMMPSFVISYLVVFSPWAWDNVKIVSFWYIALAFLAAATVVSLWRRSHSIVPKLMLAGIVLSLTLTGVLTHMLMLTGDDRWVITNADGVRAGEMIREETPAGATIASSRAMGSPVNVIGGRQMLVGYEGWLWVHGLNTGEHDRALRAIFALGSDTPSVIDEWGVDYVVVGPSEQNDYGADPAAFRAQYPVIVETENYAVFDVGGAPANPATLGAPTYAPATAQAKPASTNDSFIEVVLGVVALLALGIVGIAALRRARLGLSPLEQIVYGLASGIVGMSLVMLLAATAVGQLTPLLVLGTTLLGLGIAVLLWPVDERLRATSAVAAWYRGLRQPVGITSQPILTGEEIDLGRLAAQAKAGWHRMVPQIAWLPTIVIGLITLRWVQFWPGAMTFDENGTLWTSQINIWGDWGMHLGDTVAFLWGDNFPPTHSRLAGEPMAYHYLSAFSAAAMAELGLHPITALKLHSFVFSVVIAVALYAFGRRVTGNRLSATLLVPLFLFGGGLGFLVMIGQLSGQITGIGDLFDRQVFDMGLLKGEGYYIENAYQFIQAQRGFLYGVPIALLVLTLLLMGVRRMHERADGMVRRDGGRIAAEGASLQMEGSTEGAIFDPVLPAALADASDPLEPIDAINSQSSTPHSLPPTRSLSSFWERAWALRPERHEFALFAAAGVAAGLLPIGHFSTVFALGLALPFVALLSAITWPLTPVVRLLNGFVPLVIGWALFGAIWVVMTVPQVLWVYGGELGGTSALRVQLGWLSGDEPQWFFWGKNLGLFALLFLVAVFAKGYLDGTTKRFFLGFSVIFVLCNIFAFLPWDWNNTLFLQWWFLSVAVLVAALIGHTWSRYANRLSVNAVMIGLVLVMTGYSVMLNLNQATGQDRWALMGAEDVQFAEQVREETPHDAIFVTGTQYANPIAILSGRPLVVGYTNWLWTQGMDYAEQERDTRSIMRFEPGTPELLAKHEADYVAIGPWEREQMQANEAAFRAIYPVVIETENWVVFAVSPELFGTANQ